MQTKNLLLKSLLAGFLCTACMNAVQAGTITYNSGAGDTIKVNTHWTANNVYVLKGNIYVTSGAVLTIDPGTLIKGDSKTKGTLIISRGCKIMAEGTPCQPIVFTSAKAAGVRQRGDWGGVIILGNAPHNAGTANIEGITPNPYTVMGGADSHDNSGILKYVRIEFAGVALSPNNEINGLTFGAVGDGTTVDYVQVSFANDDSFEWFGGTVNCKHLIAFRGIDDDFDTDNGFSGKVQFGMGLRDPLVADVSQSGGFESDNDATGTTNLPQTRAIFCNMSVIAGSDSATNALFKGDLHIRRNSHMYLFNSVLGGYPKGFEIDGQLTHDNVIADTLFQNNILSCTYAPKYVVSEGGATNSAAVIDLLLNHANNQFFATNAAGANLIAPYNLNAPNFRPNAGSPALTSPVYSFSKPLLNNAFFTPVSYLGAFDGTNDWTATWTEFDPVNVVYGTKGIDYTPKIGTGVINPEVCTSTGSISIAVSGGLAPYTFAWSNSATTQNISNLIAGDYTVNVYPKGGVAACKATKTYTVKYLAPAFTGSYVTSTSIDAKWDNKNIASYVSGFLTQIRYRLTSPASSAWSDWGGAASASNKTFTPGNRSAVTILEDTVKSLTSNKSYTFQIRGVCQTGPTTFIFSDSAHSKLAKYKTASAFDIAASEEFASSNINEKLSGFNVYPNPAKGSFKIDITGFSSAVTIKVTNMSGQVVYTSTQNAAGKIPVAQINTSNMPSGLYTVEVSDGIKTVTKKISIIQ